MVLTTAPQAAQRTEGNFIARNFRFASGESLPELRLHYTTLGRPRRDAEGVVEREYTINRFRKDQNTTYEGDDVMGNARNYGRALFTSQHFTGGDVWKIKGREYLMDDSQDLAVVWELFKGDMLTQVHFGHLTWKAQS